MATTTQYLDKTGLEHFWTIIKTKLDEKIDSTSDLLMTQEQRQKLEEISAGANRTTYTQTQTSGVELGKIEIDGVSTEIYAPADQDTHYTATFGTSSSATTTYFDSTEISDPYLKLIENNAVNGAVQLVGGDNITIVRGTDGKVTISASNSMDSIQIGNILAQESATGGWAFVAV